MKFDTQLYQLLLPLASSGNVYSMKEIATLLIDAKKDLDEAVVWLQNAVERGDGEAAAMLGKLADENDWLDVGYIDYDKIGADFGDVASMYRHGMTCLTNHEYLQALEMWDKAATSGHVEAAFELGQFYANPNYGFEDWTLAKYWFTVAAEAGNASAQNNLGLILYSQEAWASAGTWFSKAWKSGSKYEAQNLGVMCERAGTPDSAKTWYTRAAEKSICQSMISLTRIYRDEGNTVLADEWSRKSKAHFSKNQQALLDQIGLLPYPEDHW